MKQKHSLKNIFLLFLSLILSLLIGDIILRQQYAPVEGYYVYKPGLKLIFYPDSTVFPGISGPSLFSINEIGLRAPSVPADTGVQKIIAIGGSTTEGLYLDQTETWCSLLQEKLNNTRKWWVGNFSKPGLHTGHHIQQLKWMLSQPTLSQVKTVLCLVGINDLLHFLSNDSFYLHPAEQSLFDWAFTDYGDKNKPFFKKSGYWKVLSAIKKTFRYRKNIQNQNGTIYRQWRINRSMAPILLDRLPLLTDAVKLYGQNIRKLIELCEANGIKIFFLTQPVLWNEKDNARYNHLFWLGAKGVLGGDCCIEYYSIESLAMGMNVFNETTRTVCRQQGIPVLDLAKILNGDGTVFYDDCHFTENGARLVAQHVFEFLLTNKIYQ